MTNPNTPASPGTEAPRQMSLGAGIALLVIAVVGVGAFLGASLASKHDTAVADDADVMVQLKAALDDIEPQIKSHDHFYNSAYINDGTGVVTTPNDAGVFTAIAASPLTAGESDGSGAITFSATTGLFTIAQAGVGEVELMACITDFASSSNVGGTTEIKWEKNGAAITGAPVIRKTEPVDAGNGRSSIGCAGPFIVDASLADTFGVYIANAGGGITGTTRSAGFRIVKLLNSQ